jgi:hypothetical protein
MHMPIARQRLGKHIPEVTLSTGHPSLGNGTNKHEFVITEDDVFRGVRAEKL